MHGLSKTLLENWKKQIVEDSNFLLRVQAWLENRFLPEDQVIPHPHCYKVR